MVKVCQPCKVEGHTRAKLRLPFCVLSWDFLCTPCERHGKVAHANAIAITGAVYMGANHACEDMRADCDIVLQDL